MTPDGLTTLVANLGVSAASAVALIWFLYTLITKTLPAMLDIFRQEVAAEREAHERALALEREYRLHDRAELLASVVSTHAARHEEHLKILDRLDFGFKQMLQEVEAIAERLPPRKDG